MKKIDVELFRYRELVFGRVLYTAPELKRETTIAKDEDGFSIRSSTSPLIAHNTLYVHGDNSSKDNNLLYYEFNNEFKAVKWCEAIKKLIDKINEEGAENTVEIERVM